MIPLSLEEVATLCPGELARAPWADRVTGVQIDSREISEGDLFVAVGRGADFRAHAFARGAAATLVPDEPHAALAALGRAVRERSAARVVGITGSTGKTSTKDILAALCGPHARVVAARGSFNNELGVPLTLCRLEPETELCIVELAMRGLGQIRELCAIARPDVGVVTCVGPVHLELVGSVERVAEAKAELIEALPAGGTAVVPARAPELERFFSGTEARVVRFGEGGDVRLRGFLGLGSSARVEVEVATEQLELEFNFTARYQAANALAALAAYWALGLPLQGAALGARNVTLSRWRGEEIPLPDGGLLINDSYNANPPSMSAALAHLVERAGARRTVAVLGDMAELGPQAPAFHEDVGRRAAELGIDALFAVGSLAEHYVRGARGVGIVWSSEGRDLEPLLEALRAELEPGDCVLVKGSRAMGLETVAEALAAVTA